MIFWSIGLWIIIVGGMKVGDFYYVENESIEGYGIYKEIRDMIKIVFVCHGRGLTKIN